MLQWSILQYLWPALSYHLSLSPLFCLFLSDCQDRFDCRYIKVLGLWSLWVSVATICSKSRNSLPRVASADNLCKQLRPRSGLTICPAWSGSKLFDILLVFLIEFFEKDFLKKVILKKKKQMTKKHAKLPSMQWVEINTYSHLVWPVYWSTLHRPLFWQAHVSQVGPW